MNSPGFMGTNQLGGLNNGLSGQSSQTLPSNSINPFTGNGIGAYIANSIQNQQHQFAQQAINAAYGQLVNSVGGWENEGHVEPLKTEGIKLGEIIGFRGWTVTPQGFLRSISADALWAPGEPMEGKTKSRYEHNGCYAFKKLSDFLKEFGRGGQYVYGKVSLWGDIIEHELGYRAQFAKVISLDGYTSTDRPHGIPLKRLQSKYKLAEAA